MANTDSKDFPLLAYLDELVENLRQLVPKAIKAEDVEVVHDARVVTRRLKAAVDLMDSVVTGRCKKPFAKVTRTLRKQLGALRDLDVMLEHLGKIKEARFQNARNWLKDRLDHCRQDAVKDAASESPPARMLAKLGSWWGLRQEIAQARKAIDTLLAESVHLQLDAFAEQAAQVAAAMAGSASPHVKNDPHQLRIAGKSLRYTLEMAKKHGVPLPAKMTSLFKKMQESLGLWHDFIVLAERILCETVECDLALHNPILQGQILQLAQTTLKKAQANLKKTTDLWTTRGQDLSAQIRAAFPLTQSVEITAPETVSEPAKEISSQSPPEIS
jgi:CHAD domain-containing protein